MGLAPFLTIPVPMLSGVPAPVTDGTAGGVAVAAGLSQLYAPILWRGQIWTVLQATGNGADFTPVGGIYVVSSADGSNWQTWDAANGPSRSAGSLATQAGFFYDGANTITVCYSPTADPVAPALGTVQFQDFNMLSRTWGAIYGVSAFSAYLVGQLLGRLADKLFLFSNQVSGSAHIGIKGASWNGAWGVSFQVDTNLPATYFSTGACAPIVDSAGRTHCFIPATTIPSGSQVLCYQLVNPNNTLGTAATIQGPVSPTLPGAGTPREPAIVGNTIAIGALDAGTGVAVIFTGTPLSAPVFGSGIVIDPTGPNPATNRLFVPVLAADATGWYAAYMYLPIGGDHCNIRLCHTSAADAASGWVGIDAFIGTSATFIPSYLGIGVTNGSVQATAAFVRTTGGPSENLGSFMGLFPLGGNGPVGIIDANALVTIALPNPAIVCCQ